MYCLLLDDTLFWFFLQLLQEEKEKEETKFREELAQEQEHREEELHHLGMSREMTFLALSLEPPFCTKTILGVPYVTTTLAKKNGHLDYA